MPQQSDPNNNPFQPLSEFQAAHHRVPGPPRRKPTPDQGAALELLGHAVEYLIDEGLLSGSAVDPNVSEAIQLLSKANRDVYLDCAELARENRSRTSRATLVLWKWLPSSTSLLPVFRNREHKR